MSWRSRHAPAKAGDTTTLRDDGDQYSLNLHVMIAVDARDGAMLGPVHAEFLRHEGGKRDDCGKRPFEEKESFRWLAATREAAKLAEAGAERITVVADRECDIYDEFALRPAETDLVIRVHHNRKLADGRWLFDRPRGLPELGRETISLPAAPGRPARDAVIALRAGPVTLKRPMRNRAAETAKLPPKVHLTLVEAREIGPPRNVTPAHWLLLTTHPVTSFNDARKITRIYRARWTIEQVNRTMKTEGFRIEASRVADGGPFENLATAVLIAAVQVMQLVGDRDGTAGRPLEDVFDPADQPALEAICATLEGNTARQKNPHKRGSLAYGTWVCASPRLRRDKPGWLDRILWQTGTRGHSARAAAVQGDASRLRAQPVDTIETETIPFGQTQKYPVNTWIFRDV